MTFQSIDNLLDSILAQPQWETQRRYHRLVRVWYQVVSSRVAQHSRPIALRDEVLWVTTSSSAFSQNLSLQRYTLIKKINRRLNESIKDIRFTTNKWYQKPLIEPEEETNLTHPSMLEKQSGLGDLDNYENYSITPQQALQQWFDKLKVRSQHLPRCPRCQTPTPEGELERWGICGCCFAQNKNQG